MSSALDPFEDKMATNPTNAQSYLVKIQSTGDPVDINADQLDSQEGSYYLARANHTGTQEPDTISPQGAGSGLDADLLDSQTGSYYLSRANQTGTQLASTISDFASAVAASAVFASRAAATAATIATGVDKIFVLTSGEYYSYIRDAAGTALTTNAGTVNWTPDGQPALAQFNGDNVALVDYIQSLSNKTSANVTGTYEITSPIQYRNSRSDSWRGATDLANVNDPGSTIRYLNTTGKVVTVASATEADPAVFTSTDHGLADSDEVWARDVTGGTWQAELSGGPWTVTNSDTNTFRLADANGTPFDGTGLGVLTNAVLRTPAAIAGVCSIGSFMQSYSGLILRARYQPEAIVWLGADNYLGGSEFSGSLTQFKGNNFSPYVTDVTDSCVVVENYKFATFDLCWFSVGVDYKPVLRLGTARTKSPNTLMTGTAANTILNQSYMFGDLVLENVNGLSVRSAQFDATSNPVRLRPPTDVDGVAISVDISNTAFTNDGGADSALNTAAIEQNTADYSSLALLPTSGWTLDSSILRDWAIGAEFPAGWMSARANVLRAHDADSVGFVIGPRALGDSIDHTNYLLHHARTGAIGIRDDRYKTYTITNITQANPGVVTTSEAHNLQDGDRIRIIDGGGMVELDNYEFLAQGVTADTFQLYTTNDAGATSAAVNTSGYTPYSTGGSVKRPYMWHRQTIGGTALSVGHGSMVFDLALDVNTAFTAGAHNLLNMTNVPITGGRYEIRYGGVIDMGSVLGVVKFGLLIDGVGVPEFGTSFDHQGSGSSANTEISVMFVRTIPLEAIQSASGVTVRFVVTTPTGTVRVRGRRDGSLGGFFCQIKSDS